MAEKISQLPPAININPGVDFIELSQNVGGSNYVSKKITPTQFFQTIGQLSNAGIMKPAGFYTIVYDNSDGSLYSATVNQIMVSQGDAIPSGGTPLQVLVKNSITDFDVSWASVAPSAYTDTTNASNISIGTLDNTRLTPNLTAIGNLTPTNDTLIEGNGSTYVSQSKMDALTPYAAMMAVVFGG